MTLFRCPQIFTLVVSEASIGVFVGFVVPRLVWECDSSPLCLFQLPVDLMILEYCVQPVHVTKAATTTTTTTIAITLLIVKKIILI